MEPEAEAKTERHVYKPREIPEMSNRFFAIGQGSTRT
jgi:hypothetical protein